MSETITIIRPFDEDQQDECYDCGARTEYVGNFGNKEVHVCLREECQIIFFIEQEEKEEFVERLDVKYDDEGKAIKEVVVLYDFDCGWLPQMMFYIDEDMIDVEPEILQWDCDKAEAIEIAQDKAKELDVPYEFLGAPPLTYIKSYNKALKKKGEPVPVY